MRLYKIYYATLMTKEGDILKRTINVVGAIIENDKHEILCAKRSSEMMLPGLWEFPGGKIEMDESLKEAVEREIVEELGCKVEFIRVFHDNTHEYDDYIVKLITVICKIASSNSPKAIEHEKLAWVKRNSLLDLKWAPADIPAVKLLQAEASVK